MYLTSSSELAPFCYQGKIYHLINLFFNLIQFAENVMGEEDDNCGKRLDKCSGI